MSLDDDLVISAEAPRPQAHRFRRIMLRGLRLVALILVGILLVLYFIQDRLIFPGGATQGSPQALDALRSRGFPDSQIIVGGWSLGGAVAIDLAYRQPVGGLIAFSTFTSMQDMALTLIPLPLPRFLFAHKFDSLSKMPAIICPILLGHGRRDTLAPFPMHERLASAARAPLTSLVIDGAEHNDFYDVGGKQLDAAITTFVGRLPR
jgi:fermentation-respiration switch protein FrsA (DUF1100 family)